MNILNQDFLDKLDAWLTIWAGRVSSQRWGSSTSHQGKVNASAPNSLHCLWRAIDLTFDNPDDMPKAASDALAIGFSGIEADLSNGHLHLDNRTGVWQVVKHADGSSGPLDSYLTSHI